MDDFLTEIPTIVKGIAILIPFLSQSLYMLFRSNLSLKKRDLKYIIALCGEFFEKTQDIKDETLRDQMNFAESKLEIFQYNLCKSLSRAKASNLMEISLYKEISKTVFRSILDKLRRMFKENGFKSLDDGSFRSFVLTKRSFLLASAIQEFEILCPKTQLEFFSVMDLDVKSGVLDTLAFDIFTEAKIILKRADVKRKKVAESFEENVIGFIPKKEAKNGNELSY